MTYEIKWLRPVVLTGFNADGSGHAWVVLGYNKGTDPDRQFLMNLGWGGAPGWYTCDSIDFNDRQRQVYQIAPEDVVNFVGRDDMVFGDGSPDEPYRDIETA